MADVLVSRGGYTGEDGFEISIPGDEATVAITEAILEAEDVKLAGLAARDSLRLEAGLCLYGHDLDETTSPIEAGLSWLVGKARTGYLGEETVKAHATNLSGIRRRVGFVVQGAPARGPPPFCPLPPFSRCFSGPSFHSHIPMLPISCNIANRQRAPKSSPKKVQKSA